MYRVIDELRKYASKTEKIAFILGLSGCSVIVENMKTGLQLRDYNMPQVWREKLSTLAQGTCVPLRSEWKTYLLFDSNIYHRLRNSYRK